jgi:hypothetical protein
MTENTATSSGTSNPTRMFYTISAAEAAYKEQVALNQSLSTKTDDLGSKIEALTIAMTKMDT